MKVQLFSVYFPSDNERSNFDNSYENFDNIGIGRIVAFLKDRGIDVKITYLNFNNLEQSFNNIDLDYDLFGFSVYNNCIDFVFDISKKIKEIKNEALIFLGSKFATDAADFILDECKCIDFVVLGYGEFPILNVIEGLNNKQTLDQISVNNKNIKTRKDRVGKEFCNTDINLLPWPDRSNLKARNGMVAYICSSHGCTSKCTFCSVSNKGSKWSGRESDDVVKEIISIYESTNIRCFAFTDGSLEDPGRKGKERLKELCLRLIEYPVKFAFRCFIRAETFKDTEEDREIISLMKKAGFTTVITGIEAGNEEDLLLYDKRATLEDNERVLTIFSEHEIYPLYGFIMMNPYSDEVRLRKNYEFLSSHMDFHMDDYINSLRIFYNTPIYHRLKSENILINNYQYKGYYDYKFKNKFVDDVFHFLREYFHDAMQLTIKDLEFWNFMHLYKRMHTILDDLGNINVEVKMLVDEIAARISEYFKILYIDNDIEKCRIQYNLFEGEMLNIYKKSEKVKLKLIKKYIRSMGI